MFPFVNVTDNSSAAQKRYARGKGQTCEYIRQNDRYAFIICKGGNNNIGVSTGPSFQERKPLRVQIKQIAGLIGIRVKKLVKFGNDENPISRF